MDIALPPSLTLPRKGGGEHWVRLYWVVVAAILFFSFVLLLFNRYKRCPSNRVLVIYGKVGGGNTARCIHGGAAFVMPLIQDYAFLNLEPHQIEIPLKGALSAENIRVNVPSVFTVAIGTDPEVMQNAAIRLLGLNIQEIKQQAGDIIFGQLRQVLASMQIQEINRDREKFLQSIQMSLEPELKKIGLVLINVNITDITDESGYIEAIGRKAAAEAVQKAKVAVAEQEKNGQIGITEADRERAIQVSNAVKLKEIGTREAQREQAVRVAQLDKEQKIGEQTAGFEREAQVKDAERQMRIALAGANAKAITGEAQAQAEVALAQANLQVKQAEAFQMGETRKREAEAAVQEAQNRAMAKAALAQAERIEAERRAAVEAPAKAERARILVEADAEAQKRSIEAAGQAKAIFAKLEAEAKGQYEILAKKAEGLRQIIAACGGVSNADAGAPRRHGARLGPGDFRNQVRQGGGLGKRRRQRPGPHEHLSLSAKPGPRYAPHDAGHERHRRRGDAGVPGPPDAGAPHAQRRCCRNRGRPRSADRERGLASGALPKKRCLEL